MVLNVSNLVLTVTARCPRHRITLSVVLQPHNSFLTVCSPLTGALGYGGTLRISSTTRRFERGIVRYATACQNGPLKQRSGRMGNVIAQVENE